MRDQDSDDRPVLSGELLDNDEGFGCHRRQNKGDNMHRCNGEGRRARWHMKMGMGGGHRHGRGGHGRGERRGGRPLGHGDLRLLILSLISETPRHGYDLIQEIETRTGGTRILAGPKCAPRTERRPSILRRTARPSLSVRRKRSPQFMRVSLTCCTPRKTSTRPTCARQCTGCGMLSSRRHVIGSQTRRASAGSLKS